MMQEGNETSEDNSEIVCTDTMKSENGRAEGWTGLYLAGADSFLITPDMNTYSMEISGTHTHTHTQSQRVTGAGF